jgi:hypothetical protein
VTVLVATAMQSAREEANHGDHLHACAVAAREEVERIFGPSASPQEIAFERSFHGGKRATD